MKPPKEFIEAEYNNGGIVKPDGWKTSEVIEAIERYVQTELNQPHVSGSLPDGWKDFEAGFLAAKDFYNKELATKNHKWILLPDKKIANAFWKWKEGNNR